MQNLTALRQEGGLIFPFVRNSRASRSIPGHFALLDTMLPNCSMPSPNCSTPSNVVDMLVAVLLMLEFGLGLLGNAIALWTFFFRLKVWKPYAIYLFNLVLADLLLTVCLPFPIVVYLTHRKLIFGHMFCQVLLFLLAMSRGVGIAFLTAVALDRYFRVVHPRCRINLLSPRSARVVSVFVWLLMMGLSHQSLFLSQAAKNCTECHNVYPWEDFSIRIIWQETFFFLQFLLPFGLILFCNAGIIRTLQERLRDPEKQPKLYRAKALVMVVVVIFGVCFVPSVLARILMDIFWRSASCRILKVMVHASHITISLTYLNSVLNPVVYCFSNPTFRYSYRKFFKTFRDRRKEAEPQSFELKDSYYEE
ncbi:12-(S)-hydroxy-5,8,10,14-eicosatetraenoic acid receptor [Dasypus novemcinctus]|uniref:12-(S)-hydroxy-5,8,10,14-eicosatetraenoic acid receptor n=1 Tax=Dasypus novemcinctus TaxID=9361 RepID=UPI00032923E5|nr:12-(S)-hydroxy-5,8,10,14-eicosatetraenoic acid receptor [Dasypus novemcinctus]